LLTGQKDMISMTIYDVEKWSIQIVTGSNSNLDFSKQSIRKDHVKNQQNTTFSH